MYLRPLRVALFSLVLLAIACDDVPLDDTRAVVPSGVMRGTALYQGRPPCTAAGHVVGNLVLLVFDQTNPPPPGGIATTPVNFGVVPGDALFASMPRTAGSDRVCPGEAAAQVTASAPFAISPLDAGRYIVIAFYDTTGDFLPTFKFRNLPELGDVAGGYLDTTDAAKHAGDVNYQPIFLPVAIGVPDPDSKGGGALVMPREGYMADNVSVTVGVSLPFARPYFYPAGAEAPATKPSASGANPDGDPDFVPVATMTQDQQVLAPPERLTEDTVARFQGAFPQVRLNAGLPDAEIGTAVDPAGPFHFQTAPFSRGGGLFTWSMGTPIPEGNGVQSLYPIVVFSKLVADPTHTRDPQATIAQGSAAEPIVVIQGITLFDDSLLKTVLLAPPTAPSADTRIDHVTVLARPSVVCFDPRNVAAGGVLVTPHLKGPSADPNETVPPDGKDLFDAAALQQAQAKLVRKVTVGCLPAGRYAINAIYSTGQAWTTPNEAGSCAVAEGPPTGKAGSVAACATKPRPVLYSQGTRAVLEVVPPTKADGVQYCKDHPVPDECIKNP